MDESGRITAGGYQALVQVRVDCRPRIVLPFAAILVSFLYIGFKSAYLNPALIFLGVVFVQLSSFGVGGTAYQPEPLPLPLLLKENTHLAGLGSFNKLCTLVRIAATS